jgi:hypothetical protein
MASLQGQGSAMHGRAGMVSWEGAEPCRNEGYGGEQDMGMEPEQAGTQLTCVHMVGRDM